MYSWNEMYIFPERHSLSKSNTEENATGTSEPKMDLLLVVFEKELQELKGISNP